MLNFNLPSGHKQSSENYSYLKGQVYMQTFAQRKFSEVRLVVDSPMSQWESFPRYLYNSRTHSEHMKHHNNVTRTQHMKSDCKIKVGQFSPSHARTRVHALKLRLSAGIMGPDGFPRCPGVMGSQGEKSSLAECVKTSTHTNAHTHTHKHTCRHSMVLKSLGSLYINQTRTKQLDSR